MLFGHALLSLSAGDTPPCDRPFQRITANENMAVMIFRVETPLLLYALSYR